MNTHKTEGWIDIRGGKYKSYKKLFMVVRPVELVFFKEKDLKEKKLSIILDNAILKRMISTEELGPTKPDLTFEILSGDDYYQLECSSLDDFNKWTVTLAPLIQSIGYFGYSIDVAIEKGGWYVPLPLYRLIPYLEESNYYITPKIMLQQVAPLDLCRYISILDSGNDIATNSIYPKLAFEIIKMYLKRLAEPILGIYYFDMKKGLATEDLVNKVNNIKKIISLSNDDEQYTLYFVLRHLHNIYSNNDFNEATISQIATTFGPCIIYNSADFSYQSVIKDLIDIMLEQYDYICDDLNKKGEQLPAIPCYPSVVSNENTLYNEQLQQAIVKFLKQHFDKEDSCHSLESKVEVKELFRSRKQKSSFEIDPSSILEFHNQALNGRKTDSPLSFNHDRLHKEQFQRKSAQLQLQGVSRPNKFNIGNARLTTRLNHSQFTKLNQEMSRTRSELSTPPLVADKSNEKSRAESLPSEARKERSLSYSCVTPRTNRKRTMFLGERNNSERIQEHIEPELQGIELELTKSSDSVDNVVKC
ncbi:rhogap domain containing protein [Entamoeba histolytica]|nr:rhogap domain containing protein [Entamoeba histolytica]